MAKKERVNRPLQTIKTIITPVPATLKVKLANAFQEVVNKIKEKHLS
jgi:hypothetical protein